MSPPDVEQPQITSSSSGGTDDAAAADDGGTMLAFVVAESGDTSGGVRRVPRPRPTRRGEALVRVLRAGVCNTDLEILKGYMGFRGILGHEFVGVVEDVCVDDGDCGDGGGRRGRSRPSPSADDELRAWVGRRCVGDINVRCDDCPVCDRWGGDGCSDEGHLRARNHCPNRTVLGILNKGGTMAEYLTLPVSNLHAVPDGIPDEVAVFAEPLAAACRIVEQGLVNFDDSSRPGGDDDDRDGRLGGGDRVAILGDGKLGLMIAEVLGREYVKAQGRRRSGGDGDGRGEGAEQGGGAPCPRPVLFGKHRRKLDLVADSGVACCLVSDCYCQDDASSPSSSSSSSSSYDGAGGGGATLSAKHAGQYDVVVDATGSPAGLTLASGLCRPMGTLVLKSTCAAGERFNAAPFVIDELRVVGSRCGPLPRALELLSLKGSEDGAGESSENGIRPAVKPLHVEKYVTKTFPLAKAEDAIRCAAERDTMKVQIICSSP